MSVKNCKQIVKINRNWMLLVGGQARIRNYRVQSAMLPRLICKLFLELFGVRCRRAVVGLRCVLLLTYPYNGRRDAFNHSPLHVFSMPCIVRVRDTDDWDALRQHIIRPLDKKGFRLWHDLHMCGGGWNGPSIVLNGWYSSNSSVHLPQMDGNRIIFLLLW